MTEVNYIRVKTKAKAKAKSKGMKAKAKAGASSTVEIRLGKSGKGKRTTRPTPRPPQQIIVNNMPPPIPLSDSILARQNQYSPMHMSQDAPFAPTTTQVPSPISVSVPVGEAVMTAREQGITNHLNEMRNDFQDLANTIRSAYDPELTNMLLTDINNRLRNYENRVQQNQIPRDRFASNLFGNDPLDSAINMLGSALSIVGSNSPSTTDTQMFGDGSSSSSSGSPPPPPPPDSNDTDTTMESATNMQNLPVQPQSSQGSRSFSTPDDLESSRGTLQSVALRQLPYNNNNMQIQPYSGVRIETIDEETNDDDSQEVYQPRQLALPPPQSPFTQAQLALPPINTSSQSSSTNSASQSGYPSFIPLPSVTATQSDGYSASSRRTNPLFEDDDQELINASNRSRDSISNTPPPINNDAIARLPTTTPDVITPYSETSSEGLPTIAGTVRDFFDYNKDTNKHICKKCNQEVGRRGLKNHYEAKHDARLQFRRGTMQ